MSGGTGWIAGETNRQPEQIAEAVVNEFIANNKDIVAVMALTLATAIADAIRQHGRERWEAGWTTGRDNATPDF